MDVLVIILGVIFSLFSTLVLSYISIATMVGPWIAPTIVLLCHTFFWGSSLGNARKTARLTAIQAIGAGGGIIATGIGFSLPMLYFLDPTLFAQWLASPAYFCSMLTLITLVAGSVGLIAGKWLAHSFVHNPAYPFPVSALTTNIITSQSHPTQARFLLQGITATSLLCVLRDGIGRLSGVLSKTYHLLPSYLGQELAIAVWPTLWAIGFSVGLPITIPLLIGLISKYLVVWPLLHHAHYLPWALFQSTSTETFTVAFCSGLILCELFIAIPTTLIKGTKRLNSLQWSTLFTRIPLYYLHIKKRFATDSTNPISWKTYGAILVSSGALLSYFNFSLGALLLFFLFCLMATYAICQIGCKIGMVPFGRFSTFIVIPMLLLFKINALQATIVCVFFNVCAAAASDLLFDYRTGHLTGISEKKMFAYQWVGLLATACSVGIILWLLCTYLQLGSEALFAQRGKAKALLLQSFHFNHYIVGMGLLFGWVLRKLKINSTMVFGGLIMPNSVTFGLVLGSLGRLLTQQYEKYQPLCAGALAAESLWVLITILVNAW